MPASSAKIRTWLKLPKAVWNYVEVEPGISLENVDVLFTKFDEKEVIAKIKEEAKKQEERAAEEAKLAANKNANAATNSEEITIDYLDKVKLKVAKILECEKVEGSNKLYKLKITLGNEERQIVSGLQKYYTEEELVGKKVVLVANLKPAKLKGIESNGMLLAAGEGDVVRVLFVDDAVAEGEDIH